MDVAGYSKTFAMDQRTFLENDQVFQSLYNSPTSDPKRQGICTGLSMIWLARRMVFHNETAKQRRDALFTTAAFRWGGKTQDIHLGAGTGSGDVGGQMVKLYGEALRAFGLRVNTGNCKAVFSNDFRKLADCATDIADQTGCYALWNIGLSTTTGTAGHMVASYMSHGSRVGGKHFYFFDPNMGEYRISAKDSYDFTWNMFEAYANTCLGVRYVVVFEAIR
jgi:hypothetical protein